MARNYEVDPDLDLEDDLAELDFEMEESTDPLTVDEYIDKGFNPFNPTVSRPGSEDKVMILSARYAAGVPLWNSDDCYDHGPRESELMGSAAQFLRPSSPEPVELIHEDLEEE